MKRLAFIDVETTGLDIVKDRIISLAIRVDDVSRNWLIYPGRPIPPESTAIHGITDARVGASPQFKDLAVAILDTLDGCDLAGYNLLNFDVPILWEEFHRAGIGWDLSDVNIIDAGNIFKKFEERTLTAAVKFYCQRDHDDAHEASADVDATRDVLNAQIFRYDLEDKTREELAALSRFEKRVDLAGKFIEKDDGSIVYGFGKNVGKAVVSDLGYAKWMLGADFSEQTKIVLRGLIWGAQ